MPKKLPTPCSQPGCRALSHERFCPAHKKQKQQQQDQQRGSAYSRGYNARWQKYRRWFLQQHPLCQCADCALLPMPLPAQVVDHIKPHKGDYALFWDTSNHQALSKKCHDKKTVREDGGFGRG